MVTVSASRLAVSCRDAQCVSTLNRFDGDAVSGSSGALGYFPGAMTLFSSALWCVTENGYLLKLTSADAPALTSATNIYAANANWITSYGSVLIAPGRVGGIVSLSSSPAVLKYLDGVMSRVAFGIASSSGYVYLFDGNGNGCVVSVHTTTGAFTFVGTFAATNCQTILGGFISGTSLVLAVAGRNSVIVFDITTATAPVVSTRTSYDGTYTVNGVMNDAAFTPLTNEPGAFSTLLDWHRTSCGIALSTTERTLGQGRTARTVLF